MRCRDVRRRLNEPGDLEPEIIDHLGRCPSCAREEESATVLESIIRSIRETKAPEVTPFADLRARVKSLSSRKNRKELNFMSRVKEEISNHPGFSLGLTVAICLFAFVVLVPMSYNRTVGYDLVLSGVNAQNGFEIDTARDVVEAIGYADVQISTSLDDRKLKIIFEDLPSKKAVQEIASAMTSLAGTDLLAEVSPVIINQMGSIYAQVRDKIDEIRVEARGKTDQQIKEEIEQKLRENGHPNPSVEVTTAADGKREIRIDTKITEQTDEGNKERQEKREIIIDNSCDTISIDSSPGLLQVETEGKTNAEIEAEIRAKLAARGMENPKVSVKELPDGRREINIEVKKEKKEE